MNGKNRWKTGLIALLVILAVYNLIPTLFNFDQIRENALSQQKPVPSFLHFFPEKEINLGLDLKGGLYVEFEVQINEAIIHRAQLIATEIHRLFEGDPTAPKEIRHVPETTRIEVSFEKEETKDLFLAEIGKRYQGDVLEIRALRTEKSITLTLSETYEQYARSHVVDQALEAIRNRIDRYGVTEPSIVRLGENRISVEIPGLKESDAERALNLIKKAGRLEFRLVNEEKTDAEVTTLVEEAKKELQLQDEYSESMEKSINQHLGKKIPENSEIIFEIQHDPVTKKIVRVLPYLLEKTVQVTGDMLSDAQIQRDSQTNQPYVSLTFDNEGTKNFAELTGQNIGKRLAIVLDGQLSKAPVIRSEIPNGQAQITLGYGNYRALVDEAKDLVLVLREGALPAGLKEIHKSVVGPSLGADSIERGVKSLLGAGILIILFMLFYYKVSGLFANVALLANILFLFAALAIFQATLTLPGIAGIVLTIGMAVDSNVLIFERMREETRRGANPVTAVEQGYGNALSAIIDSNLTTFLSGVVLYQFGTGPIRGFAVTLMIGIATSLFTVLVITRLLQDWLLHKNPNKPLSV